MEKEFKIRTQFIFDGDFFVKAKNGKEAIEKVENHCGLTLGSDIHSALIDVDWDFDMHPKKRIMSAKRTD